MYDDRKNNPMIVDYAIIGLNIYKDNTVFK